MPLKSCELEFELTPGSQPLLVELSLPPHESACSKRLLNQQCLRDAFTLALPLNFLLAVLVDGALARDDVVERSGLQVWIELNLGPNSTFRGVS